MAVDAGNARLIKDTPGITMQALKPNEVKMLFGLAIVGVAALAVYFLLFPMFTNLAVLQQEIDEMTAQRNEYQLQVARIPEFEGTYKEAESDYFRYISYFYDPMVPEMIDERITSMLISHDMSPISLTMTNLTVEGIPQYMAEELRANPVPVPLGAEGENAGGEGGTPTDQAADGAETAGAAAEEYDTYVFVYTMKASAYGERDNLYTFLAQVGNMTAMKVTAFDFTDKEVIKAASKDEKDTVIPGIVNIEMKLYVFVEGVTAREQSGN